MVNSLQSKLIWLTIDTDDIDHHPTNFGHPKRTKHHIQTSKMWEPSTKFVTSMNKFRDWYFQDPEGRSVTLFVIAEQLNSKVFRDWLDELLSDSRKENGELWVGCHGLSHKCWSAWGEDKHNFKEDLLVACSKISSVVGVHWRPWFRAPGGYIAPWMAKILKDCNIEVDTSINPSSLLIRKSGKSSKRNKKKWNGWDTVSNAMSKEGITEREWLTSKICGIEMPACGPALHIPLLKYFSKRVWYNTIKSHEIASENAIINSEKEVFTLYWHLLDYSRDNGKWKPPYL